MLFCAFTGHNTDGKYFITSNKLAFHAETKPRRVQLFFEKEGSQMVPVPDVEVTEIACGVNHTVCYKSSNFIQCRINFQK